MPEQMIFGISQSVTRLETQMGRVGTDLDKLGAKIDTIDDKLSRLEHWRSMIVGGFIVLSLVFSALVWVCNKAVDAYIDALKSSSQAVVTASAPSSDVKK